MIPWLLALALLAIPGEIPADAGRGLAAVPLPATADGDPAVAEVLAEIAATLQRTLAEPTAPTASVAAAYGRLGLIAQAHQYLATARAAYRNALVLMPEQPLWTYALGVTEEGRGDLDAAMAQYRRVLARLPDDGPARFRLGEMLRGLGRLTEAETELTRALGSPAVRTAAWAALGQLAFDQGRDAEAIRWLEAALAAEPRASRLHYPLALAYHRRGDSAAAERHLALRGEAGVAPRDPLATQLQELATGETMGLLRGRLAFQAGDFPGALQNFERALEHAPESAAARVGRAAALAGMGRDSAARQELEKVLAADPEQATARFNLATLAQAHGDLEAAEKHYARYLDRFPEDREALLAQGEVLRRRGDSARALEHFVRADAVRGANGPEALLGRIAVLLDVGRTVEAETLLLEAERRWPLDPRIAEWRRRWATFSLPP